MVLHRPIETTAFIVQVVASAHRRSPELPFSDVIVVATLSANGLVFYFAY
jgi:hypothetical protein